MGNVVRTSNGHQTSLQVRQNIPEFVVQDHPKFVNFIEKYYEFMANNSLMATTSNSSVYYYGADTAAKILQDIKDVDKTDFDNFVEMFRRQYAYTFPQDIYSEANKATLYKNLVNFYQSVGAEDSFKMLFRLIYNEEIEIYYPGKDILVASGGDFVKRARIRVNYVDGLNQIENKKIVGANSGAYGTVERVEVMPKGSDTFITGRIANTITNFSSDALSLSNTIPYAYTTKYNEVSHPEKILENTRQVAHIYLSNYSGTFDIHEDVYYSEAGSANTSVCANTIVLPVMKRLLLFDGFQQPETANAVISVYDSRHAHRANSTNPPWGHANIILGHANTQEMGHHIFYSNTGLWHTTGDGEGQLQLATNSVFGSLGGKVLQIGNNSVAAANGDYRQLVYSRRYGYGGEGHLYRLTVRARDIGGNSAFSTVAGNRFSAGIVAYDTAERIIDNDQYTNPFTPEASGTYDKAFWLASDNQSIDDEFYNYVAYFKGREKTAKKSGIPLSELNRGNGGRLNLPSGTKYYNSLQKALDGEVKLPYGALWFTPTIKVNQSANGATYSQGVTQIDYVALDELSSMQKQEGAKPGAYREDSSLLSSSSRLYDGKYWQHNAYDIRSKQQVKDYKTVVRESTHPAGMGMFGTKITDSSANGSYESVENNLTDTFTPDQLDSLAAWWRADAIGPQNVDYKKWSPESVSNGIFGTNTNRMPSGFSSFDDDPTSQFAFNATSTPGITDGVVIVADGYSGSSPVSSRALKIVDEHTTKNPRLFLTYIEPGSQMQSSIYSANYNIDDYGYGIVLEPNKKWLLSLYAKTSNNVFDGDPSAPTTQTGKSLQLGFMAANTSGYVDGSTPQRRAGWAESFAAKDTWQRFSNTVDLTSYDETRYFFQIQFANALSFSQSTGNTEYHIDGVMVEEYTPSIHGTSAPYTPSPYVKPGMNGANVISWFDQSPNKHHVYANTYGGLFYAPQYIANAVGGKPAIRFSANTAKNFGNVYQYSSIGGTVNSVGLFSGEASNFKPPTSGFQAKMTSNSLGEWNGGTLANPALTRPVTNTWTIMAVVKSNMAINATSYNANPVPTIINSGYANNPSGSLDRVEGGTAFGTLNLGYNTLGETGSLQSHVVNSLPGVASVNTSHVATFNSLASPATNNSFRIVGISVNASTHSGSSVDDLLNFHIDGRRFANSEINNVNNVTPYTGMSSFTQNNYVTSIGKWRAANTTANQVNSVTSIYRHGTRDWDGDIAEILVFNDKLANVNIAKVEGYLAHKYGLQENLKHKDDDGNGGPEVEKYRWEFANTADGWDFQSTISGVTKKAIIKGWVWEPGEANGAIHVEAPGSQFAMRAVKNTAVQIDGSAYDKFAIRFNTINPSDGLGYGRLGWRNTEGATSILTSKQLGSAVQDTGWHEHYIDLSGQSTWVGKKIFELEYLFDLDNNGGQQYYVDWIYLSGNNHPHPYRYNAPPAIGANSWNLNY